MASSSTDIDVLTIKYELNPDPTVLALQIIWAVRSPPGTESNEDIGRCIAVDPTTQDVFCGGQTTPTGMTYGPDFLTMRIMD